MYRLKLNLKSVILQNDFDYKIYLSKEIFPNLAFSFHLSVNACDIDFVTYQRRALQELPQTYKKESFPRIVNGF